MADPTIFIIRHAEKPDESGVLGINGMGQTDPESLTPRGWQRAGTWLELFAPSFGQASELPTPIAIYASAPASHQDMAAGKVGSKSRRPLQTVTPLAEKLGITINLDFSKGQEAALALELANSTGITLVCWPHEKIDEIAKALASKPEDVPDHWPDSCFNAVFQFHKKDSGHWRFGLLMPVMLDADSTEFKDIG